MTSDTSAVLAAIDSALTANGTVSRDWSSPDAMHWSPDKPEPVICHGARPLMPERWSTWRHGTYSLRVTADTSEFLAQLEAVSRAVTQLAAAWAAEIVPGMQQAAKAMAAAIASIYDYSWVDGTLHWHAADAPRRVLRRCRACHPEAFTEPLAIDGHAYRRRQRARQRRG